MNDKNEITKEVTTGENAQELSVKTNESKEQQEPEAIEVRPFSDVFETEKGLTIVTDLPGVDGESIDLSLDNKVMTLEGKTPPLTNGEETGPFKFFKRQFLLPDYIDVEAIKAQFNNGVMCVTLPRMKAHEYHKIAVSVN